MEIKNNYEIKKECESVVKELIRVITKETSEEQNQRMLSDIEYLKVVEAFSQLLFTLKTNEEFNRNESIKLKEQTMKLKETMEKEFISYLSSENKKD